MLPANRAVHLVGDGPFATYLQSTDPNQDMIVMGGDYQVIEELTLLGPNTTPSPGITAGRGIRIWRTGNYSIPYQTDVANQIVYGVRIRNCRIQRTASWGLYVDDAPRAPDNTGELAVWGMYDNLEIRESRSGGCVFIGASATLAQYFKTCTFKQYVGRGLETHASHVTLIDCQFESNSSAVLEFISGQGATDLRLHHCGFNSNTLAVYSVDLLGSYENVVIDTCTFVRNAAGILKGIRVGGFGRGVAIVNPEMISLDTPSTDDHIVINESTVTGTHNEVTVIGGSAIDGTGGVVPLRILDGAALTQLINGMSRLRLPRLTTPEIVGSTNPLVAALGNLVPGDMVFDRTADVGYVYTSTGWRPMQLVAIP
jgi:hypothetical protein